MAANPFTALQVVGKAGTATPADINRVQEQVRQAFQKVANQPKAGIKRVTSKNGSIVVTPASGIDAGAGVDLALLSAPPGMTALNTPANGPLVTGPDPVLYLQVEIDGSTYYTPLWKAKTVTPVPPPPSGLVLWVKGDAGVTLSGSNISAWADQSPGGNDLSYNHAMPLFESGGFDGIPAVHFQNSLDGCLFNTSFPWPGGSSAAFSIFVVFQMPTGPVGFTRLVDFNYPSNNRSVVLDSSGGPKIYTDSLNNNSVAGLTTSTTYAYVVTVDFPGAAVNQYLNDFSSPASSPSAPTGSGVTGLGVNLGGLPGFGQTTDSLVAEFGIYDHALDSTELAGLQNYLTLRGYSI